MAQSHPGHPSLCCVPVNPRASSGHLWPVTGSLDARRRTWPGGGHSGGPGRLALQQNPHSTGNRRLLLGRHRGSTLEREEQACNLRPHTGEACQSPAVAGPAARRDSRPHPVPQRARSLASLRVPRATSLRDLRSIAEPSGDLRDVSPVKLVLGQHKKSLHVSKESNGTF